MDVEELDLTEQRDAALELARVLQSRLHEEFLEHEQRTEAAVIGKATAELQAARQARFLQTAEQDCDRACAVVSAAWVKGLLLGWALALLCVLVSASKAALVIVPPCVCLSLMYGMLRIKALARRNRSSSLAADVIKQPAELEKEEFLRQMGVFEDGDDELYTQQAQNNSTQQQQQQQQQQHSRGLIPDM
jgi:hypothetical protein